MKRILSARLVGSVLRCTAGRVAILTILAVPFYAGIAHGATGGSHGPIVIASDSDFASCACVTGGSGTSTDPYIIGPWSISNASGNAIYVDGTNLTKSFTVLNPTITGSGNTGIVLNHINPSGAPTVTAAVYGKQSSIQTNQVGILVENSSYVTLDGAGENPGGVGVAATGAGTINKNASGAIDVERSDHVTVRGWQMSANGPSINPDWVTLDPSVSIWSVGGVRFFKVSASTIDHNAANNDTDVSYTLFDSNDNVVSNNTADYPFVMNYLLTDGSSFNAVTRNEGGTGDFIDIMVADPLPGTWTLNTYGASHDNLISNNQVHADGPTGTEKAANVVPAFLGGVVTLNGTFDNTISNNVANSDTGGGFVWAQVVRDSTTPIGVTTYPPTLHCNVTASEGGGGVASLNGNLWTGNSSNRSFDPCIPAQ